LITEEQLGEIIRKWNPEKESVIIIKNAIKEYGGDVWGINNDSLLNTILNLPWSEKYFGQFMSSGESSMFGILSIDFDGNCLYGDWDNVDHITKLQKELADWHREQEKLNAIKN